MHIVDLRTYRDSSHTPLLILVDAQQEYLSGNRALALPGVEQALDNCRAMLDHARMLGYPVAFLRWVQNGKFFRRSASATRWIDGLGPCGEDMVFDREFPSCYASDDFARMMESGGGANAVIAGFTGTIACLATIIDAYHRQHTITFVEDASASHATGNLSSSEAHRSAADIARLYCPVVSTDTWITAHGRMERQRMGTSL